MSVGIYKEAIGAGGTLEVKKAYWEISYYWFGPDLRYNGESFTIPGDSIEDYIQAYAENLQDFQDLKLTIPKGGEFTKVGALGMMIRIGKFPEGVCLRSNNVPIASVQQLEVLASSYRNAKKKASDVQKLMANL